MTKPAGLKDFQFSRVWVPAHTLASANIINRRETPVCLVRETEIPKRNIVTIPSCGGQRHKEHFQMIFQFQLINLKSNPLRKEEYM